MKYERKRNVAVPLVFNKRVPAGTEGYIDAPITEHGFIRSLRVRFAAGEAGTLQIRPVVILPGDILVDLVHYAGDSYLSGDNEDREFNLKIEVENHSVARVFYKNIGEPGSDDSFVNVDIEVEYFEIIEPANIIG